jgi:hypothetical protein
MDLHGRHDYTNEASFFRPGGPVQRLSFRPFLPSIVALILAAHSAHAQNPSSPPSSAALSREQIGVMASVFVAISRMQDSTNELRTQAKNKTRAAQQQLQENFLAQRAEILHHAGITEEDYAKRSFILETDNDVRKAFDSVVAVMTGVPTPGQVAQTGRTNIPVPAGPVGAHIGHVINSFSDTPDGMGLLPAAMAEARIAAQHATLAARDLANLNSMQTHAGHVLHALDPTLVPVGPGRGYGMKKAANAAASHIELAAKAQGASPNVIMHATHIATASRAAVERADQLIALAQLVQNARTAAEASPLIGQMVSLSDELIKGVDTNADGKIGWEKGEGGLQQADEHLKLLLAAEMK